MNLSKPKTVAALASISDAQTRTVQRRVVIDGKTETRREKIPNGQTVKIVKPSGAVVRIPLYNGRANINANDPYRLFIEQRKVSTGGILYGRCPQTMPSEMADAFLDHRVFGPDFPMVPDHVRGRQPCRTGVNGGPISNENPCQCVEDIIAWRKQRQAERMGAIEIRNAASVAADAQSEAAKSLAAAAQSIAGAVRDIQPGAKQRRMDKDD